MCECGVAGLAEPGLQLRGLKAGDLWEAMLDAELGKLFSQPAETRNCASGGSSEGPWRAKQKSFFKKLLMEQ